MSTAELSIALPPRVESAVPRRLFASWRPVDLAMDLGTANTLIYARHAGIILNEPSLVAVERQSGKTAAIGRAAKEMFGKTAHNLRCVRPMKDGVIADFETTALMIKFMLGQVCARRIFGRPQVVVGVPAGITQVEKKAVMDAVELAGARRVLLVEEPMAAALGAGLPVGKPVANMIVDIGGGTTEVAILSMHSALYSHSIRLAGDEMDQAIQRHIRRLFNLEVGMFEAERIKMAIGSALPLGRTQTAAASGRDLSNGLPRQIEITDAIVREALQEPIAALISSVSAALEQTSPEAAEDIVARGVFLAGGGALLSGLSERLQRETGIRFHRASDPLSCVARGAGRIVDDLKEMKALCIA